MEKGILHLDAEGKVICQICRKSYHSLDMHINMSHKDITVKDYKIEYGLNMNTGMRSEVVKEKLRESVKKHYDEVVAKNLIKNGDKTRFKDGGKGRTRDMIQLEELKKLKSRLVHKKREE